MTDPRYMGFFEFDGVDPERCREDYGGSMTDAEREAVLAYMAASRGEPYKGLAPSRIEGTWRWWTEEDKRQAREHQERLLDYYYPFRIKYPTLSISEILSTPEGERAERESFGKGLLGDLLDDRDEKRPGVNGTYDAVTLGCCDMYTPDGKWIFPQMWDSHYIVKHGLTPDREFVKDAVAWRGQNAQQTN